MIPEFDSYGNLPPGVYSATLSEIEARFAYTSGRKQLFLGFKRLAENLKVAGSKTLYLNGSYVTSKRDPRDYDACWEPMGVGNKVDRLLVEILSKEKERKEKYFGDIFPRMPELLGIDHFMVFQMDEEQSAKGILMVDLRRPL